MNIESTLKALSLIKEVLYHDANAEYFEVLYRLKCGGCYVQRIPAKDNSDYYNCFLEPVLSMALSHEKCEKSDNPICSSLFK